MKIVKNTSMGIEDLQEGEGAQNPGFRGGCQWLKGLVKIGLVQKYVISKKIYIVHSIKLIFL